MTARQVIQEIQELPPQELEQVLVYLQDQLEKAKKAPGSISYLEREKARPLIREMLAEHPELFRKLAQ
jgi:hypothetical protein